MQRRKDSAAWSSFSRHVCVWNLDPELENLLRNRDREVQDWFSETEHLRGYCSAALRPARLVSPHPTPTAQSSAASRQSQHFLTCSCLLGAVEQCQMTNFSNSQCLVVSFSDSESFLGYCHGAKLHLCNSDVFLLNKVLLTLGLFTLGLYFVCSLCQQFQAWTPKRFLFSHVSAGVRGHFLP